MTENEAQEIVYGFVDVLVDGAAIVCDEDRLRHSKEQIKEAFRIHIAGYERLRILSETLFREKGYDKDLSDLQAMRLLIDDFKTIAPEDKGVIEQFRTTSPATAEAIRVLAKYLGTV